MLHLEKERNRIYSVLIDNKYDLGMLFLRYQEYYESEDPMFFRKKFKISDYMAWYAKKYGKNIFTYPDYWAGFNIPTKIIFDVFNLGIDDENEYDKLMMGLMTMIKSDAGTDDCYIIGYGNDSNVAIHEMAHALFYIEPEYKKSVLEVFNNLKNNNITAFKFIEDQIVGDRYSKEVMQDEMQAYMLEIELSAYKREDVYEVLCNTQNNLKYIFNSFNLE